MTDRPPVHSGDESRAEIDAELPRGRILSQIDEWRDGKSTELRMVTVSNSTIGDTVDPSWDSPAAARSSDAETTFSSRRSARKRPRMEDCAPTSTIA
jgi:hypothetical protein